MEPVIKCLRSEGASLPEYQSQGAAGADARARLDETVVIPPGARRLVPTGLRVEIPRGFEIQVRPRSGLALKHGVTVLNSPGTVDSDYRGEIGVLLVNLGDEPFAVNDGDRIAQLVVARVESARFEDADSLSGSDRGEGGYGSTGRR